jgi:RNA polymerase sigma-70 factor (ECF subfamily)
MPGSLHTEAEQDQLLLEIYAELRRNLLRRWKSVPDAEDAVQDIALGCLIKLRAGRWHYDLRNPKAYIETIVRRYLYRRYLKCLQADTHDGQHLADREAMPPAWISPERFSEERDIERLRQRVLARLPYRCRTIYALVRDERLSYHEVAARLAISFDSVRTFVSQANKAFRKELGRVGYDAKASRSSTPSSGASARSRRARRRFIRADDEFTHDDAE